MAIFDIRDMSILEGDGSSQTLRFTLFLDQVATTPVSVRYFTQPVSASDTTGDFFNKSGTATVPIGADRIDVTISVRGDTQNEGNETFELLVTPLTNAEAPDGAVALSATATIFDNDDAVADPVAGAGALAERIYGPATEPGVLPTLGVRDVSMIEGNSSSDPAFFLITLDRPATAVVTGRFFTEGITASESKGDIFDTISTFRIEPGQTSVAIAATVLGDTTIEPDETFRIVIYDVENAVLQGGAVALEAIATINDDDGGVPAPGGIAGFGDAIEGAIPASGLVPTVRVYDTAVIEGNSSSDAGRFMVVLDRPADAPVTMSYSFNNGSAVADLGDFSGGRGTLSFAVGEQAKFINSTVFGDISIEGDETYQLVLTDLVGGVFENEAPALVATGTIVDDDGGSVSGTGGRQSPGLGLEAPVSFGGTTMDVVDVSIIEANGSSDPVYVYVLLSQPATAPITVTYQTISGSAIEGSDFVRESGTLTFQTGEQSSYIDISIFGDSMIEGDEQFTVQFTQPSGAAFASGGTTLDATVVIRDNDGGPVTGSVGPDFRFLVPTPGATPNADVIMGTPGVDTLRALAGNDKVYGLAGNDTLFGGGGADYLDGGTGADVMVGGAGNDFYIIDNVGDVINGEIAFSLGGGIDTARVFINNYIQPNNVELVRLGNITDTDNWNVTGNDAPGTLVGNAGNNVLTGRGGNDQINGNNGNDVLIGNTGRDTLVGGNGSDTFVYTAYADSRAGILNRDVINGFDRLANADDLIDLSAMDANTTTFGVNDAFNFVGGRAFSGAAGELRTQGLGGANAVIIEGDHNGDRVADFQIFVNLTTYMTGTDFIL